MGATADKLETWVFRLLAPVLLGLLVYQLFFASGGPPAEVELGPPLSTSARPYPRHPAPELPLTRLNDQRLSLRNFNGQVLLVAFWAPWCGPCKRELPALERLAEKLGGRLRVLAVATNYEAVSEAVEVARERGLKHAEFLLDPGNRAAAAYEVRSFPTSFLIDRQGVIRYRGQGLRDWDEPEALQDVAKVEALP